MKVLLYCEAESAISQSGIGRAVEHQQRALREVSIEFTTDVKATDYDLLHINTYGLRSKQVIRQARREGKPVIYHAHSTEEDFRNSFVGSNQLAPLVRKHLIDLYSRADHLITPTPYAKELLENYGLTVPITAISNGIDLSRFAPDAGKEANFRRYFKLQPTDKVIISVGLYFERKGIVEFIEVARNFPEYTFIWFGKTPLYSIPRKIRQLVTTHHPANVIFPGYIKGDIIEGAYSAADLFFFPSYEETEGIVVLEALASKQTVLIRDIPVYEEWLQEGKECYKGNEISEFCEKLEKIITGVLPPTEELAYKVAQERSLCEVGKQLSQVYKTVLAKEMSN